MSVEKRVRSGLLYLQNNCDTDNAFQNDKIGAERNILTKTYHPPENFTSIIALDFLGNLLDEDSKARILKLLTPKFGHGLYGTKNMYKMEKLIPDDIELTGLIMWTFLRDGIIQDNQQLLDVARLLILNVNADGVMETYFPPRGFRTGRIDAPICCSSIRLLYTMGLDGEAINTENYLFNLLKNKGYLNGSRYYFSPDTFPLYLARAVRCSTRAKDRFIEIIYDSVKERLCSTKFPVDISMRILTLDALGLLQKEGIKDKVNKERATLESLQEENGAFQADCLYKKGRSDTYFGGNTISTILSVAALNCFAATNEISH